MWRAHDGAAGQLGALPMEFHKQNLSTADDPEASVVGRTRASRLIKQESKMASRYLSQLSNRKAENPPPAEERYSERRPKPWGCSRCGHVNPPGESCEICGLGPPT